MRALAKDVINARIKAIESGEEIPMDALSQILKLSSIIHLLIAVCVSLYAANSALHGMGMEKLVDNFYNFLGAGLSYITAMCTVFKVIILAFVNVITAFQTIITMQFITNSV